jgi:uncharacterized protein (TIGR02145 family)
MKTRKKLFVLTTTLIAFILMAVSCEEEPLYKPLQVETRAVTEISAFSAIGNGAITNQGTETILSKGICYSATSQTPDLNSEHLEVVNDDLEFSILLEELDPHTKYYVRAYATNELKTVYGQSVSFTTEYETITDIDGNEYRITKIGDQVWTIDNLKVTHFNDGTPIQEWTEDHYWDYSQDPPEEPAYCWYDNDYEQYGKIYGALYNFYTASDPRIAPEGWRVPTYEDGQELEAYLGGSMVAGGKMKLPGTEFWSAPNTGATNSSGFSAKGGGFRSNIQGAAGQSTGLKDLASFWTQTFWGGGGMTISLLYDTPYLYSAGVNPISGGRSIRLIKE